GERDNAVERAVARPPRTPRDVTADLLPTRATPSIADAGEEAPPRATLAPAHSHASLEAVERDHILSVLRQTNWLITGPRGAAQVLGLNTSTLRTRMHKLSIIRATR